MNSKTYKQRTKILKIPVVGTDDHIIPEVELRKYQIIENMLLACLKGMKNCVFEEGVFSVVPNYDKFSVFLRARGSDFCAIGIAGGAFFAAPSSLEWPSLEKGRKYFLYISGGSNTFVESCDVRATAIQHEKRMSASVLMATIDLTGNEPVLNTNPDTKIYTTDLGLHVSDSENPHGEQMIQNELCIRHRIIIGEESDAILEIRSAGETIEMPASLLVPKTIEFTSAGMTGIVLKTVAKVSSVIVSRKGKPDKQVSEIGIGYFGDDSTVPDNKSFIVYNSGEAGIPMKATIFFG
jgi:hypothetical protein